MKWKGQSLKSHKSEKNKQLLPPGNSWNIWRAIPGEKLDPTKGNHSLFFPGAVAV